MADWSFSTVLNVKPWWGWTHKFASEWGKENTLTYTDLEVQKPKTENHRSASWVGFSTLRLQDVLCWKLPDTEASVWTAFWKQTRHHYFSSHSQVVLQLIWFNLWHLLVVPNCQVDNSCKFLGSCARKSHSPGKVSKGLPQIGNMPDFFLSNQVPNLHVQCQRWGNPPDPTILSHAVLPVFSNSKEHGPNVIIQVGPALSEQTIPSEIWIRRESVALTRITLRLVCVRLFSFVLFGMYVLIWSS